MPRRGIEHPPKHVWMEKLIYGVSFLVRKSQAEVVKENISERGANTSKNVSSHLSLTLHSLNQHPLTSFFSLPKPEPCALWSKSFYFAPHLLSPLLSFPSLSFSFPFVYFHFLITDSVLLQWAQDKLLSQISSEV